MTSCTKLLAVSCLLLVACVEEKAPEYCRNHAQFHGAHAASTGSLQVTIAATGEVHSELRLPPGVFGQQSPVAVLETAGNVLSLQTAIACGAPEVTLQSSQESIIASYESHCGADNKIGQLDIVLFDRLPLLDEVEVIVTTPVTQKHFAINRQCDSAIFRLE